MTVPSARWWFAALGAGLLIASCSSTTARTVTRSCPRPTLEVRLASSSSSGPVVGVPSVPAGSALTASGTGFRSDCVPASSGHGVTGRALPVVRLFVVQGSRRVSVAQVNAAGAAASFTVTFGLPPDLLPGPMQVAAQRTLRANETPLATAELVVAPS